MKLVVLAALAAAAPAISLATGVPAQLPDTTLAVTIEGASGPKHTLVSATQQSTTSDGAPVRYVKSCAPDKNGNPVLEMGSFFNGTELKVNPALSADGKRLTVNAGFTASRLLTMRTYAKDGCSIELPSIDTVGLNSLSFMLSPGESHTQTIVDQGGTTYKVEFRWQ